MSEDINIVGLGKMAKLTLSEAEETEMRKYMDFILGDLEKSAQIGTDGVKPLIHGIELTNVLREDKAVKKISRDALLLNAPEHSDGYFKVPKTID